MNIKPTNIYRLYFFPETEKWAVYQEVERFLIFNKNTGKSESYNEVLVCGSTNWHKYVNTFGGSYNLEVKIISEDEVNNWKIKAL